METFKEVSDALIVWLVCPLYSSVPVPSTALQPAALNVMLSLPATVMPIFPVQEVAPLDKVNGPPMVVPPLFTAVTVTESMDASLIMLFAPRLLPASGEQDTLTSTVFETDVAGSLFKLHDPKRQSADTMKSIQVSFFMSLFLFN
jgi:hypothetical protein